MQLPPEKLGSFYLGAEYDLATRTLSENAVNYDARDLTTHAVCVGMTGSGKTGLCIGLLEEAALDKVPAIIAAQVKIAADALANVQGEAAQARLRGQLDGLLGIPKMWGKRQQIQNRRQVNDSAIERLLV